MSLNCTKGGQGKPLQNVTCKVGQDYCAIVHPLEGTKKDQKFRSCFKKSTLTDSYKYTRTPAETLTCQEVIVNKVDISLCVCTKDYCNYGSVLKVSKRNLNFDKSLIE